MKEGAEVRIRSHPLSTVIGWSRRTHTKLTQNTRTRRRLIVSRHVECGMIP